MIEIPRERRAAYLRTCRVLAVVSTVMAALYLKWLLVDARPENLYLYWLLVLAEIFNIAQAAGFWYTISVQRWTEPPAPDLSWNAETVDVFVTVLGEPVDVVERTVAAAAAMRHPRTRVHVLDDGHSEELRGLAARYGAGYITRADLTGAKAGNLNHALSITNGALVAVFDADQVPHPDFLTSTIGAFADEKVAFVQTPQVYRNRDANRVAAGAHDQQGLFYGPIMRGKDGSHAVFSCGTNVVYRRSAIEAIGGLPEDSITEDLRASLLLLERGFTSVYVPKVLADGLGPLDVQSYFSQQLRWGRGGLEILFKRRPYSRRMSFGQALQYSLGFMYWFTGWAYLAYLVLPTAYLTAGLRPVQVPNDYPVHFLPYALAALATIIYASDFHVRFDALWFTLASFPVHVHALFSTFFGRRARFVVTPKLEGGVTLRPVRTLLAAIVVLTGAAAFGLVRFGAVPSAVNNVAWAAAHIVILLGFVRLALRPHEPAHAGGRAVVTGLLLLLCAALVVAIAGCSFLRTDVPANAPPAQGGAGVEVTATAAPLPLAGKVVPPDRGAYLGVYVPPGPFEPGAIDTFEKTVGKSMAIVMWYQPWAITNRSSFDTATVVAVMRRGKVPMITWEPWDPGSDANKVKNPGVQPGFRLAAINSGAFDDYIRGWARAIRGLGGPVMLRPMHEMNGDWYPWSGTTNGNTPAQFVAAWRRIHDLFAAEGATNVTWVWSVNHESVPAGPKNAYGAYYPGDAYVDWTAMSGFNWGKSSPYSSWGSYSHWYDTPLAYLRKLGKPICIAEFASVEQGGNKAAWLTDAYARIAADPAVDAVVYFDSIEHDSGTQDWRVDSSAKSLAAFRSAVAPAYFIAAPPPVLPQWVDSLDARQWKYLASFDPLY
ncbi:MAG TPA: glycosyltransferase [Coriobacteriia bacterium]